MANIADDIRKARKKKGAIAGQARPRGGCCMQHGCED